MSWLDDAYYDFELKMYDLGLRATPPVVMPINPSQSLQNEVDNIPSMPSMFGTALSESAQTIGGFMSTSLPIILICSIAIYFIYKKEFANA